MSDRPDAVRLEELWSGEFGDRYVDRNQDHAVRQQFWAGLLSEFPCERVLEVGCNIGGNLRWIAESLAPQDVYGVDVNLKALKQLHDEAPEINAIWSPARELPFRDGYFDLTFTMGVLIHQPEDTLPLVMAEIVRTSRRYVVCGEYYAENTEEVPYRGETGALFRRDYGGIYQRLFPQLQLVRSGFLGRDEGWDDVTWWLLERRR